MSSYPWTFKQVGAAGRSTEVKTLELSGYNAPFGRPRKDPVATEVIESRVQQVRYPGNSGPATRHAFGTGWEEMELKGRWMTKAMTKSGETAESVANEWMEFLRDERDLEISWGPIASWTGFLKRLELARESQHEIAWKMVILVDENTQIASRPSMQQAPTFDDDAEQLAKGFAAFNQPKEVFENVIKKDIFESLDDLASQLNEFSASFNELADKVDSYEKVAFSTIQHFRSVFTGMTVAITKFRGIALNTAVDTTLVVRDAKSDIEWMTYQTELDVNSMEMLFLLTIMGQRFQQEGKGAPGKYYQAEEGDTWERLLSRYHQDISKVTEIRKLNGIKYGEEPVAGVGYVFAA